jgi:deoxyribodipyrimidine photo-lyase
MQSGRCKTLRTSGSNKKGKCVVYVMSRDQRVRDNPALFYAQQDALANKLPLAVIFILSTDKGARAREHYRFMIDGLKRVESELKELSIPFMLILGDAFESISSAVHHLKPHAVYCDFSPLKRPRRLVKRIVDACSCSVYLVDAHNIVPVWVTSEKQEYSARTIRPKIYASLDLYLEEPIFQPARHPFPWPGHVLSIEELSDRIHAELSLVASNSQQLLLESGSDAAQKAVGDFIRNRLPGYTCNRNKPEIDGVSPAEPVSTFWPHIFS